MTIRIALVLLVLYFQTNGTVTTGVKNMATHNISPFISIHDGSTEG
jgi:hypothetical protein